MNKFGSRRLDLIGEIKKMIDRNRMNNSSSDEPFTRALRVSESQFRQLVDGVRDYAIFLLDTRGHIASWNQGAEQIKGYGAHEIIGRHFSVFYPPELVAQHWPEHELKLAGEEGRFEDEGWRVRKDGSRFWAAVTITALRNESGTAEGFLVAVHAGEHVLADLEVEALLGERGEARGEDQQQKDDRAHD